MSIFVAALASAWDPDGDWGAFRDDKPGHGSGQICEPAVYPISESGRCHPDGAGHLFRVGPMNYRGLPTSKQIMQC